MDNLPRSIFCRKCRKRKPVMDFSRYCADTKAGLNSRSTCDGCRPKIPASYEARNRNVRIIGFASYREYLQSELWQTIRGMVLERDEGKCVVCGAIAADIHHNDYELDTLLGKRVSNIVCLCRQHHKAIEFDGYKKNDLAQARRKIQELGVVVVRPKRTKLKDEAIRQPETPRFIKTIVKARATLRRSLLNCIHESAKREVQYKLDDLERRYPHILGVPPAIAPVQHYLNHGARRS